MYIQKFFLDIFATGRIGFRLLLILPTITLEPWVLSFFSFIQLCFNFMYLSFNLAWNVNVMCGVVLLVIA